jgi:hypothetical protein
MKRNDTFSSDNDDRRDGRQIVLDNASRDMTKMELRISCSKLKNRCNTGSKLQKVMLELHLLKSKGRNMKQKIRSDFCWDGDNANMADKITYWVKLFLFPRYKFLKNGWMVFSEDEESLSAFVRRHNLQSILHDADYEDLWERVICPVIQGKYISIRSNLSNDIHTTFKGECQE